MQKDLENELVCRKIDIIESKLRELGLPDMLKVIDMIRTDCEHMQSALISRKLKISNLTSILTANGMIPPTVAQESYLPPEFNPRAAGCCMVAARIIAGRLIEKEVNDSAVVEGWIQFIDEDGRRLKDLRFAHTWVYGENGEIIDPTIVQFSEHGDLEYSREVKDIIPAREYMKDFVLNTEHPEIFFNENQIPDDVKPFLFANPQKDTRRKNRMT